MLTQAPLAGIKVLDFTTVVVGPVATQFLGDYGADVIKIEPLEGDLLRRLGGASRSGQMSPKFLQMNRNKRSLAIDMRQEAGRNVIRTMIADADVLVLNMRPRALAKLGLTYDDVRALNSRIIHCSLMGFGQDGRYRDKPAYDTIIQGSAGVAACNYRTHGEPWYVPMVLADHLVANIAIQMVLLALRSRDLTGESQSVEIPMFENMAAFVLQEHMGQKAYEPARGETGDPRCLDPGARPAPTSDGYVCISANTDTQTRAFFEAIERPELKDDPRFISVTSRAQNVSAYFDIRTKALKDKTTAEWIEIFDRLEIPAMPFQTFEDVLDDPHLQDVGLFQMMEYPEEGTVRHIGLPNKFSGGSQTDIKRAPVCGEHSVAILQDAGYSSTDIETFIENGVLIDGRHDI